MLLLQAQHSVVQYHSVNAIVEVVAAAAPAAAAVTAVSWQLAHMASV